MPLISETNASKHVYNILLFERSRIHIYYMNLLIDAGLNHEISTSHGADVRRAKSPGLIALAVRVALLPDTASREKAVMNTTHAGRFVWIDFCLRRHFTTVIYSTFLNGATFG